MFKSLYEWAVSAVRVQDVRSVRIRKYIVSGPNDNRSTTTISFLEKSQCYSTPAPMPQTQNFFVWFRSRSHATPSSCVPDFLKIVSVFGQLRYKLKREAASAD
jgi:hypothetical protein